MQSDLRDAASPIVAAALERELKTEARRHGRQRLGPDGCRELATRLLDLYPDETLSALAARVGPAARKKA